MQTIIPNLWCNGNAQEMAEFYTGVFPGGKIVNTSYYPDTADEGLADFQLPMAGKVLTVEFEVRGMRFVLINAGPEFAFSEAISFQVDCKDQAEIDYFWEKLSAVPESEQCGWCKDKFGLSWQIVPENMNELMKKPGAFKTLMNQHKITLAEY